VNTFDLSNDLSIFVFIRPPRDQIVVRGGRISRDAYARQQRQLALRR